MTKDIKNISEQIEMLYNRLSTNRKLKVTFTVKWKFKDHAPIFTTVSSAEYNNYGHFCKINKENLKSIITTLGYIYQNLDKNELLFIPIVINDLTKKQIKLSANHIATFIVNKIAKENI